MVRHARQRRVTSFACMLALLSSSILGGDDDFRCDTVEFWFFESLNREKVWWAIENATLFGVLQWC
jgi:hypothetical protein